MSNEVVVRDELTPEVQAIMAQQDTDIGEVQYQTPILKLCQGLTKEVAAGDAEAGEFLNTLTGDSYGTKVDFVVAYYQNGRAITLPDGRYFPLIGQEIIPESWAEAVGEQFVGTPFSEHPDAEETYKERVNAGEIEWGKGPKISTLFSYTGLVVNEELDEPMPARIDFKRTTKSAHDKLMTLKGATLRNRPFWDVVFELSTESKQFGRNEAFIVKVKKARDTTPDEKELATRVALAAIGGATQSNAEDAERGSAPAAPAAQGGLGV